MEEADQLPQQLCLQCVSELNKCFAFRERARRTHNTLKAYLDLSDSEEESEAEILPLKPKLKVIPEAKEDAYEEIEVTDVLVNADANNENLVELDVGDFHLLNPTSSKTNTGKDDKNEYVFIIQDMSEENPTVTGTLKRQLSPEKPSPGVATGGFECSTCKIPFVRKKNYDNHMVKFHENEEASGSPSKKRLRLKLTKDKDDEQQKQNLEENPEAKKCKICGALYANEKSLKLHEKRRACKKVETFTCEVCQKVFTDEKMFTEHKSNHPQEESPPEPAEEAREVDPAKKYQCNICSRGFKMMSTLKDHLRTHTGGVF